MDTLAIETLILLFAAAALAGFIDTLAGGGGLIAIPALIMSGVPPLYALGTNKLQGSMGTLTASFHMFRSRRVNWREARGPMLAVFLFSGLGSVLIQFVDTEALRFVVPVALLGIAIYFIISPKPERREGDVTTGRRRYRYLALPGIGFYDGAFGPGTGSFFALAGVALKGESLVQATAVAKTLNFATNVAALLVFFVFGKLLWVAGLVMIVGQFVGASLGSHFLLKVSPVILRWLVVVVCLTMLWRYGGSEGWW